MNSNNNVQNFNIVQNPTYYNIHGSATNIVQNPIHIEGSPTNVVQNRTYHQGSPTNITRVMANDDEISEQILHRNKEKVEVEVQEHEAPEARDRELTEKFQNEIQEVSKFKQLKRVKVKRGIEDGLFSVKIEKESKHPKLELERLRAVSRESNTRARSSEKKSSNLEDKVYGEDDEEREGNFVGEDVSLEEELERPCEKKNSQEDKVYEENFVVEEAYSELLRPSEKSSIQEDKVYEKEDDEERKGNFVVEEASLEEELERPSKKKSSIQEHGKDEDPEEASSEEEFELPVRIIKA